MLNIVASPQNKPLMLLVICDVYQPRAELWNSLVVKDGMSKHTVVESEP